MVSERYVQSKLMDLNLLDLNKDSVGTDLQYFYGIYDTIMAEFLETSKVPDGIYKEYCSTFETMNKRYYKTVIDRLDKNYDLFTRIIDLHDKTINNGQ